MYIRQHAGLWIAAISLESRSNKHKTMSLIIAFQVTMVLICVWVIPFTIFILPFTLEKFAILIDKHDKALKINFCTMNFVRRCVTLDVVTKLIIFVPSYLLSKNQSTLEIVLRYLSFFMATTLEVSFGLICFELVVRLNYATETLKLLRNTATINVSARHIMQISSLRRGLQHLVQAKYVAEKGYRFFLLINIIRHFMFILASAVSTIYSGSNGFSSLNFVALISYSFVHYFLFSLCADHLQKKVCETFCAELSPFLNLYFLCRQKI
jgi:hypothetical protein